MEVIVVANQKGGVGKTIAVANQKGGVDKTTTALNVGAALVREGKKVLLIDCDPQANLTMGLGYKNPDALECTLANIMMDIISDKDVDISTGILKTTEGIDLIPSSIALASVDVQLTNVLSREYVLSRHIDNIERAGVYDFIIIDTLPYRHFAVLGNAVNKWFGSSYKGFDTYAGTILLCKGIRANAGPDKYC